MEGGFFHASTGWEHLLPPQLRQLWEPWAVGRGPWDLLALTPLGCRLLAGHSASARVLLLPGDCPLDGLRAETVVTYGLSPRDSVTFSGLTEPVLCVQRALPLVGGGVLEPQEFPLPNVTEAQTLLPCAAARLLWTGSPYPTGGEDGRLFR